MEPCCMSMMMIVGSATMLISAILYNLRRSRCTRIDTPCLKIERSPMTADELKADTSPENQC
jgi:hypothetical protein